MKSAYRNPLFRRLTAEIIARTPAHERFAQTLRAEDLLSELGETGTYPYSFYYGRIARAQPESALEAHIPAEDARHDLCQLVNDVSDSDALPAESLDEHVLTVDEVARMCNVSTKTIHRWRRRGLVGRRFLIEGRKRLGFLRSSVDRFVDENAGLLRRSSQFQHVSREQREEIAAMARGLVATGSTHTEVVNAICRQTGRCSETVRAIIRRHDQDRPADPILTASPAGAAAALKEDLYRRFRRGESIPSLASRCGRAQRFVQKAINQIRAERIMELPLDYIDNEEFAGTGAEHAILAPTPVPERAPRKARRPSGIPSYLASLYEVPLLNAEQERHLFRKYNFLKYRAAKLREQLDVSSPRARLLDAIEQRYQQAVETKNKLVRANLRLVVSIAKRYTNQQDQLFDLVSDGNMSLIRAVEKFDYGLGNKFSTYGSWAIKKNYARRFATEMRHHTRFRTSQEEALDSRTEYRANPLVEIALYKNRQRDVERLLDCLSDRERQIITSRYGLAKNGEPQTLKEVGAEMGVSKERIRQIEARAINKLRQAAQQQSIDSPAA